MDLTFTQHTGNVLVNVNNLYNELGSFVLFN